MTTQRQNQALDSLTDGSITTSPIRDFHENKVPVKQTVLKKLQNLISILRNPKSLSSIDSTSETTEIYSTRVDKYNTASIHSDEHNNDSLITLKSYDILAMEVGFISNDVELWHLSRDHRRELETEFKKVLREFLGPDVVFKFSFYKGSLIGRFVAWCRNAWDKHGKRIKNVVTRIVIDVKKLLSKLQKAIYELARRIYPHIKNLVIK
ncbi:MAG: hypothetical protein WBA93_07320, partial [Microcoleaceae cyanobacterium]